ncbi:MAG: hypothetical protein JOZ69_21020 [Myxococcales bacterium]|nr:hypothetical protein [Myxococcales bacterium]
MIVPVEFDRRCDPERIGTGPRHACEILVHPEDALLATGSNGGDAGSPMGPDP